MVSVKYIIFLVAIFFISIATITAQISTSPETEKFFQDRQLGYECNLINSRLSIEGQIASKTFSIEIPEDGNYYLSAWVMGTNNNKGLNSIDVKFDDQKIYTAKLNLLKNGWQSANLISIENNKIKNTYLPKGIHQIAFCSIVPESPAVDFIRLSRNEEGTVISEKRYQAYIDSLSNNILPNILPFKPGS